MTTHSADPLISRLWTAARGMLARLRADFSEAVALTQRLCNSERAAVRAMLTSLEAMVRKIVLIEAIALARAGAIGGAPPAPASASGPRLTLIPLPPSPVRFAPSAPPPAASTRAPRRATLRLWPRNKRNQGPRIRSLAPARTLAQIAQERAHEALVKRLARARAMRRSPEDRLARRIAALARLVGRSHAAALRLARQLARAPKLALTLALRRTPHRNPHDAPEVDLANSRAAADAWALNTTQDTS